MRAWGTSVSATLACLLFLSGCTSADPTAAPSPPPAGSPSASVSPSSATASTAPAWPRRDPAAAGFDPARLRAAARQARRLDSTCFAVVRNGRLVGDWNWRETTASTPREVFSITKSVASALVGIAAREGHLDLDDRASRYVPQWRGTPSAQVTIRHLLSNASGRSWSFGSDYEALLKQRNRTRYALGVGQQFEPGTTWRYNNAAVQTLDAVLRAATGEDADEYGRTRLFEPLGMSDTRLTRDPSGRSTNLYLGMQTTCEDLARFGSLYLDEGRVDGRRLLDRAFVRSSIGRPSTPFNAAYGLLWWLNRYGPQLGAVEAVTASGAGPATRIGRLDESMPEQAYAALGLGGQTLLVDPTTGTIVVRLGVLGQQRPYDVGDAARALPRPRR